MVCVFIAQDLGGEYVSDICVWCRGKDLFSNLHCTVNIYNLKSVYYTIFNDRECRCKYVFDLDTKSGT